MNDREMFELLGTPAQQDIAEAALERCDFPFRVLAPKLKADTGREAIPIEWADLSRWARSSAQVAMVDGDLEHPDHPHHHVPEIATDLELRQPTAVPEVFTHSHAHVHVEADGDRAHGIAYRERTLGLAWYSGKVSLDLSLERTPELAIEVLLAEGAHMVDFFYMTDADREAVFDAFHATDAEHGHGWFEETGNHNYWAMVGEAFMAGFIKAFAPSVPVTLGGFEHAPLEHTPRRIREQLLGGGPVFATKTGRTFHDAHRGVKRSRTWPGRRIAMADGLAPCGVCRP